MVVGHACSSIFGANGGPLLEADSVLTCKASSLVILLRSPFGTFDNKETKLEACQSRVCIMESSRRHVVSTKETTSNKFPGPSCSILVPIFLPNWA